MRSCWERVAQWPWPWPWPSRAGRVVVLRLVDDQGLGRQQHAGDRGGVDERGAGDLDRVEDALGDQVAVLLGGGVVAGADATLADLGDHDVAVDAAVLGDPAQRLVGGLAHDAHTGGLVTGQPEVPVEHGDGVDQRGATAGDDALLDRGARRGDGVLDAVLLLLQLHLGGGADLDHAHAAGELGEPLLELLAVPVGVGVLDLGLDLVDAALDLGRVTGTVDDRGVVLGDDDAPGLAEHLEADLVQLETDLGGDDLTTGQGRDVLHHRLAAVAEGRALDRDGVEGAADLVDDQRRQRLALDVLGEDEERLAGRHDLLEHREQVVDRGDLALDQQDVRLVEDGLHPLGVGDEVGRDVALVELHPLGELQLGAHGVGLLDRDHAVLADLVEGLGEQVADHGVARADGRDRGHVLLGLDLAGGLVEGVADGLGGGVHAALEAHRVDAGGDRAQTLVDHRLGEHGRGGGAVTGDVVGLGGDLLGQLGTEVLERVVELDLTGDGHAVVGDRRGAPLLVEDDVATLGAERHLDGVGEGVDTPLQRLAGGVVELQDLGHQVLLGMCISRTGTCCSPLVALAVRSHDENGRAPGSATPSRSARPMDQ